MVICMKTSKMKMNEQKSFIESSVQKTNREDDNVLFRKLLINSIPSRPPTIKVRDNYNKTKTDVDTGFVGHGDGMNLKISAMNRRKIAQEQNIPLRKTPWDGWQANDTTRYQGEEK